MPVNVFSRNKILKANRKRNPKKLVQKPWKLCNMNIAAMLLIHRLIRKRHDVNNWILGINDLKGVDNVDYKNKLEFECDLTRSPSSNENNHISRVPRATTTNMTSCCFGSFTPFL